MGSRSARAQKTGKRYARRAQHFGTRRTKLGLRRVFFSIIPALQITLCAIASFAFCKFVLGHQTPMFAATASVIALGFSHVPRTRKVLEVSIGCTLGVALGDLVITIFGRGLWQAAVVLFTSILVARFIDNGVVFSQQMGLQAIFVVLLPELPGGPFERSVDAMVGGGFALLLTIILSSDPRREPRRAFNPLLRSFKQTMDTLADALEENNKDLAWKALTQMRGTNSQIETARQTLKSAQEVARIAPAYRRHRHEVRRLVRSIKYLDFAVRNSRVYCRRVASALDNDALDESSRKKLGEETHDTAKAIENLRRGLTEKKPADRKYYMDLCREQLNSISHELHPKNLDIESLEGVATVATLRPLVVDLLESSGLSHAKAAHELPNLD